MTTDELDLVAAEDPAKDLDPDPTGPTARTMRDRIVADEVDRRERVPARRFRRRGLVVVVASLSIATGAIAIAERGPFASRQEACASPGDRNYPYPECASFITAEILAEVEEDGSGFERQVLADGQITRAEYEQAAEHTVACIQDAFDEVVDGAVASAIETPSELGFRYGFQVAYPPEISSDDLPWSEESDETADDDSPGPAMAEPLTDAMIQRDPMQRCPQEHFHRVSQIWQAQQIARQDF